jgi:hypothetical protein
MYDAVIKGKTSGVKKGSQTLTMCAHRRNKRLSRKLCIGQSGFPKRNALHYMEEFRYQNYNMVQQCVETVDTKQCPKCKCRSHYRLVVQNW